MQTFLELATSRREWIETILKPWCGRAARKELLAAALEWADIAGTVDPEKTLWTWAWGRFPQLVHEELPGINETVAVQVTLNDGTVVEGFPDARQSTDGQLVLVPVGAQSSDDLGPFSIDDVANVIRL